MSGAFRRTDYAFLIGAIFLFQEELNKLQLNADMTRDDVVELLKQKHYLDLCFADHIAAAATIAGRKAIANVVGDKLPILQKIAEMKGNSAYLKYKGNLE